MVLSTQCSHLIWFKSQFQLQKDPRHTVKVQGHCVALFGKLMSYTWGRCSIWLTGRLIQSIFRSILWLLLRYAVMYPKVDSMPHSKHWMRLCSHSYYNTSKPVHFRSTASSDMLNHNTPVWNVIFGSFASFVMILYHRKRLMITFSAFWSNSNLFIV